MTMSAVIAGLFAPGTASADVFEVGQDGALQTRTGTGSVEWQTGFASTGAVTALEETEDANVIFPEQAVATLYLPSVPPAYQSALIEIALANDLSPNLLEALVWQESRWNNNAVSSAGARGLAQLMPGTARLLGVDARDPIANLAGGARYLRQQLDSFGGNLEKALAAYNAGPGRVIAAGGIPNIRETRLYVAAIMGRLAATQP
jgi:soluble lytic murein transglycosylase-like protein